MKAKILTVVLLAIQIQAIAQISTRDIAAAKEYEKPQVYDSTYFFYKPDVDFKQYINQRIYILPNSETNKDDGYRNFYTKNMIGTFGDNSVVYKPNLASQKNGKPTKYNALANKYFKILDIETRSDWEGYSDFSIKLFNEENNETFFYCPASTTCRYRSLASIPFILESFFEHNKNKYVGKEFIAKDNIRQKTASQLLVDINTGKKIVPEKGSKWTCVDITLVDLKNNSNKYFVPVLIFKDSNNHEVIVNFAKYIYNEVDDDGTFIFRNEQIIASVENFYTIPEYEFLQLQKQEQERLKALMEQKQEDAKQERYKKLIDMYGKKYADLIVNEKVSIGMTKNMCKEAWGIPFTKDKVTLEDGIYEAWSYNYKTFLYFENDILKLIKE